ncbi:MAG: type II asparaginase [Endomicrobium sp.]|nr:type II asparaginase [Endomicrobium sp.]
MKIFISKILLASAFIVSISNFAISAEISDSASQSKANIAILGVGGTIAGQAQSAAQVVGYKAAALSVDDIVKTIPEISSIANISLCEQIAQIDSKDMTDFIWLTLAKRVNQLLSQDDIDGVVITHGTDTMEETAYFLNLTVKSDKPVILVGAMRPNSAISADGPRNLYNAVVVAGSKNSKGYGVMVLLNDRIFSARTVTKTNTILPSAFNSIDFGALGYVVENEPKFYNKPVRLHTVDSEFDISKIKILPKVDIVYSYAGTHSDEAVKAFVKFGAKGIIHAGTGDGSIHKSTMLSLIEAKRAGIAIVRSTRVAGGIVAKDKNYDDNFGFISADSLNPQKAKILLQLALTKYQAKDNKKIQELFEKY